jgi:hypothetical protein
MSSNRVKYDQCAYDLQMKRSTDVGDYRLSADFAENYDQCYSLTGPVGAKSDVSLVKENMELSFEKMAATESQLSWRNQLLTKCNNNLQDLDTSTLNHKPMCSKKLVPEDTRFTSPIDNFRGMSLTDYMVSPYLPINPQCHIQPNCTKLGLNSRLSAKDMYTVPPQPVWDEGKALPINGEQNNDAPYMNQYMNL